MTEKKGMKALELWCRRVTEGYPGVKIENMTTSWRDGLAFCALIHHFRPDLIDFDNLDKRDIYKNNELAFRIAERQLGIPALLDAEDMVEYEVPDRLSILTYLSQFYQAFVSNQQGTTNSPARTHSTKVAEIISSTKTTKSSKVSSGRLETCWSCRRPVFLAERLVVGGKLRHRTCFTCKRCGNQLNLVGFYETETGDFVCETCPDEEKRGKEEEAEDKGKEKFEEWAGKEAKDDFAVSPNSKGPKIELPETRESSLEFEKALESVRSKMRRKFLGDLVDGKSPASNAEVFKRFSDSASEDGKETLNVSTNGSNGNQRSTANIDILNVKIKRLLGEHFSETLSLLNQEPENFIADVSDIIDGIISDAVKEVENVAVKESHDKSGVSIQEKGSEEEEEEKAVVTDVKKSLGGIVPVSTDIAGVTESCSIEKSTDLPEKKSDLVKKEETKGKEKEKTGQNVDDYPEDLNPFAEEEDEDVGYKEKSDEMPRQVTKPSISPRKGPAPAARNKVPQEVKISRSGQKIIEAPVVNLNPFWSDGEPSSDEDIVKPTPVPRRSIKASEEEEESPFARGQYGSFTSLNSSGSTTCRKKKGPAPQPPQSAQFQPSSLSQYDSILLRSPSPTASLKSHRKSKPAPPPPLTGSMASGGREISPDKKEKNYENKLKQNLSVPDKSSYGKWKRKKGLAPALPIPQRRRITPLPLEEFYRELEDLEIQQRELERQGVSIEQTIRMYEVDSADSADGDLSVGKDVEDLVLQLFDIVNQKNELFRRQAELMYLRRQQRLEEEHADLEYQIRCLMGRSERNKTDSDKAQEEELIRRLVEVVERRNEIIECLDMDRKREVEEDESIHHHLEVFAGKKNSFSSEVKHKVKGSPSHLLKLVRKKKLSRKEKKEKMMRRDADKDVDEEDERNVEDLENRQQSSKTHKPKKKWFLKMNI